MVFGSRGRTLSSWLREVMSSLVKALCKWYLTVRGLMNSRVPIIAQRDRETLEAIQHRRAHLMQAGERALHLRLDTRGARHTAARRLLDQVFQQRRLADPRLTAQDQYPALTRPHLIQQPIQRLTLGPPTHQARPRMAVWHSHAALG